MKKTNESNPKKKMTSRQLVAIVGIVLLVLLYIVTLIMAIVDSSDSAQWFRLCLVATFVLPLVIWIYSWMYSRFTGKATIGDPESAQTQSSSSEEDTLK